MYAWRNVKDICEMFQKTLGADQYEVFESDQKNMATQFEARGC